MDENYFKKNTIFHLSAKNYNYEQLNFIVMLKRINSLLFFSILLIFANSCTVEESKTTVSDIDGNIYHTIKIGSQTWMVENLKTTKFNDGTAIPSVSDGSEWPNLTSSAYCWYQNDVIYKIENGALYNWYAVNTGKLAPKGWHVPSDVEWTTLENYLIANGFNFDGTTTENKIAKSMAATIRWDSATGMGSIGNDLTKNNKSGFTGLPSGCRYFNGSFNELGRYSMWWSSTEKDTDQAIIRFLFSSWYFEGSFDYLKTYGFSVRCIQD